MKKLLSKIATVVTLAVASTLAVQAQLASTVEYGRTTLIFDPSFTAGISSLGAQLGGTGFSSVDSSGTIVFPVVSGAVDLQTGLAELNHLGGLSVNANGLHLRLQNFLIDTTGAPSITCLLIVNNQLIRRIPLFSLTLPPGISLPLPTTAGVLQVNSLGVTISPGGAAAINSVFGNNAIPGGMLVGTMNIYAVLSPNSNQ